MGEGWPWMISKERPYWRSGHECRRPWERGGHGWVAGSGWGAPTNNWQGAVTRVEWPRMGERGAATGEGRVWVISREWVGVATNNWLGAAMRGSGHEGERPRMAPATGDLG